MNLYYFNPVLDIWTNCYMFRIIVILNYLLKEFSNSLTWRASDGKFDDSFVDQLYSCKKTILTYL